MITHPTSDVTAALSGLEDVVATATFLRGDEVDEVLIASVAGAMSVVTHQGCDPTRPDAGSSGVLAARDIDDARREFDSAVEEATKFGRPAIHAFVLRAQDFAGRERWLAPSGRHRVAWSRHPTARSVCMEVASTVSMMERSTSNGCDGVEEVDPSSIRAVLALLEIQHLASGSKWKIDGSTTTAFQDDESGRLLVDRRTGMLPRDDEHLAAVADQPLAPASPVLVRTHLDPREIEFDIVAMRGIEEERARPLPHGMQP